MNPKTQFPFAKPSGSSSWSGHPSRRFRPPETWYGHELNHERWMVSDFHIVSLFLKSFKMCQRYMGGGGGGRKVAMFQRWIYIDIFGVTLTFPMDATPSLLARWWSWTEVVPLDHHRFPSNRVKGYSTRAPDSFDRRLLKYFRWILWSSGFFYLQIKMDLCGSNLKSIIQTWWDDNFGYCGIFIFSIGLSLIFFICFVLVYVNYLLWIFSPCCINWNTSTQTHKKSYLFSCHY